MTPPPSDTMTAVSVKGYGGIDENVGMSETWPKPVRVEGEKKLLLRVLAFSTAPGDVRVLSGKTSLGQSPPSGFPCVPCGDVCGVVVEADAGSRFQTGDVVAAQFDGKPFGAAAQYYVVREALAEVKPATASPEEAAALPATSTSGMLAVERYVNPGDRVLVIAASGAVGTTVVQLARTVGKASYIAAVASEKLELVRQLGADLVVDHTAEQWWTVQAFKDDKFDVIIDLWGGADAWCCARKGEVLKRGGEGGRYVTLVGDERYMKMQKWWDIPVWLLPLLFRYLWTMLCYFAVPRWYYHIGLDLDKDTLSRLFSHVDEGRLKVILDEKSPFDFTAEGVRAAYRLQKSKHAHGRVVVRVAGL